MIDPITEALGVEAGIFTVHREEAGNYQNGRWIPAPDVTPLTFTGSVQPMSAKEIERLEDARHIKAAFNVYTTDDVRLLSLSASTQPDRIEINGEECEVAAVEEWTDLVLGGSYRKIVAVRREVQP